MPLRTSTQCAIAIAFATACTPVMAQPDPVDGPSLWITDDVNRTVYQVTLDGGTVLNSFISRITTPINTVNVAPSGIALDPTDGTLWIAQENRGRLINYTRDGTQLDFIDFQDRYGAVSPEGIAIDFFDGTLWVVDDPIDPATPDHVYHIRRDGSLIAMFPTTDFSPSATSQQAIAIDPFDGTLWITDNATDTIYNVANDGELNFEFSTRDFDPPALNLQGISVDTDNGTLWITDRTASQIYNVEVSRDSVRVLDDFSSTDYDLASTDPTGVAFDGGSGPAADPVIDLGAANGLTAFALRDAEVKLTDDAQVIGDIAIPADAKGTFEDSHVGGDVIRDRRGEIAKFEDMRLGGDIVVQPLSAANSDARDVANELAALAPTQRFGEIKRSRTILGDAGVNVIEVEKIELKSAVLTIEGEPSSEFIFNVEKEIKLDEGSEIRLRGLTPAQVLFNIESNGAEFKKGSIGRGIFLSLDDSIKLDEGSELIGAAISGDEIEVKVGSVLRGVQ